MCATKSAAETCKKIYNTTRWGVRLTQRCSPGDRAATDDAIYTPVNCRRFPVCCINHEERYIHDGTRAYIKDTSRIRRHNKADNETHKKTPRSVPEDGCLVLYSWCKIVLYSNIDKGHLFTPCARARSVLKRWTLGALCAYSAVKTYCSVL